MSTKNADSCGVHFDSCLVMVLLRCRRLSAFIRFHNGVPVHTAVSGATWRMG